MSLTNDAVVRARLASWQRHISESATGLVPAQTGNALTALAPMLEQLITVNDLSHVLVADLRQTTDSSLGATRAGRDYLAQLAAALAHTNRAAAHLSTTVIGLADTHRLTLRPGTAAPVESQLAVTLGHAAALRSLHRALEAVTRPLAGPEQSSDLSSAPVVGQHSRAVDADGIQPTRRRP
ncbi:hypothetical protein RKD27_007926 [Streptomyces sp. SAI-126]|uniref:hypothetical protein n=1 Tax=Streptomyces sp. SAI-126 TaxID=3377732 RepID=UPI003C7A9F93